MLYRITKKIPSVKYSKLYLKDLTRVFPDEKKKNQCLSLQNLQVTLRILSKLK